MNTKRKKIALIYGGEGFEHEISVMSAENLYNLIDGEIYEVIKVKIEKNGQWYLCAERGKKEVKIPTFPARIEGSSGFLVKNKILPIDCIVPCLHGNMGEDGVIQGALTAAGIKYVGQDVYASAFTADKAFTKLAAEHLKIPTARFITLSKKTSEEAKIKAEGEIGYPMFIKPARLGSSLGAKPILNSDEFCEAYENALKYDDRVMIEELVSYEYELECGYFNGNISAGGKILSDGAFYDFDAKYKKNTRVEVSTGKDGIAESIAAEYSKRLADFIGIRHLARIDFFVTRGGEVLFNEINAFPGMTASSLYPKLTVDIGCREGEFINLLIESALRDDRSI